MITLLLLLFTAVCMFLLLQGMLKRAAIYGYPFLAGAVFRGLRPYRSLWDSLMNDICRRARWNRHCLWQHFVQSCVGWAPRSRTHHIVNLFGTTTTGNYWWLARFCHCSADTSTMPSVACRQR